jgi:hypothetical protein
MEGGEHTQGRWRRGAHRVGGGAPRVGLKREGESRMGGGRRGSHRGWMEGGEHTWGGWRRVIPLLIIMGGEL